MRHLLLLYALHSGDYKVITGKVSNKKREEIVSDMKGGGLHVIFATQLADEGLDIPNLDTLHLVHPTKSEGRIEQRIGRTQRVEEGKNKPIVYDYFWITMYQCLLVWQIKGCVCIII